MEVRILCLVPVSSKKLSGSTPTSLLIGRSRTMKFLIYQVTNKVNGKIYVGCHQTENVDDGYMGSGKLITRAIKKYGIENFEKRILTECFSFEEMLKREAEIVNEEFLERNDVYNLTKGGGSGWYYCNKSGKNLYGKNGHKGCGGDNLIDGIELIEKLKKEGRYEKFCESVSYGLKEKIKKDGFWWIGKKHKDSTKEKIGKTNSIKQKGEKNSQFGTCWIHSDIERISKKINKEDLKNFVSDGWKIGRKMIFRK